MSYPPEVVRWVRGFVAHTRQQVADLPRFRDLLVRACEEVRSHGWTPEAERAALRSDLTIAYPVIPFLQEVTGGLAAILRRQDLRSVFDAIEPESWSELVAAHAAHQQLLVAIRQETGEVA